MRGGIGHGDRDSGARRGARLSDHPALPALEPDEEIRVRVSAGDSVVILTDKRLAIASQDNLALDVPLENLLRIEFDIERGRGATLVIFPMQPEDMPQVVMVPASAYEAVAQALVVIGRRLALA
jgi:hypothetical protein